MSSTPSSLIQSSTADISVELALPPPMNTNTLSAKHEYHSTVSTNHSKTMMELLLDLSDIDETIIIHNNGYKIDTKICDTLQGELYKALNLNAIDNKHKYVAIKKTNKDLLRESISIQDSTSFCVTENIIKEAEILKYLTLHNTPIGNYIIKYIDFFQSQHNYYLVMEYIASETNLKRFIFEAKQYIQNGKLSMAEYKKSIKYLLWQLFVTVQWLHLSMKCCHLDLCSENILLENANFIDTANGMIIDRDISIKLSDFGVSEIFKLDYLCWKQPLSLENTAYSAPKVFDEVIYDAECADNWSLGMIMFECVTVGQYLYEPFDIYLLKSGYWALKHHRLKKYLALHNLLKYFNVHSFSVLKGLLDFSERRRLKGMQILKEKWFNMYYQRYKRQINKKFSKYGRGLEGMTYYK